MLKQQILSRKYGNIFSVLGGIFLPYFLKKLYIMHTPEKVKFWQSRGQRFDPAFSTRKPVTVMVTGFSYLSRHGKKQEKHSLL